MKPVVLGLGPLSSRGDNGAPASRSLLEVSDMRREQDAPLRAQAKGVQA